MTPSLLSLPPHLGGLDSLDYIVVLRGRDLTDDALIRGVDGVVDLAPRRVHKLVVDETLVRALDLHLVCLDDGLLYITGIILFRALSKKIYIVVCKG